MSAHSSQQVIHCIVSLFNPSGYQSRYQRYHQFAEYIGKHKNAVLWTIEGVLPGQAYTVTDPTNPYHVQVALDQVFWVKEMLLNMLERHIPDDGNPIAWIDGDILFARPDWVEATLEALQTYDIVQMFSECQELTDDYTLLKGNLRRGMVYSVRNGMHLTTSGPCAYPQPGPITTVIGHCGYAWAMRRETWRWLGGLLDHAVIGSGDYQMATAWLGDVSACVPSNASEGYRQAIRDYATFVDALDLKVGYVSGIALHLWHGRRKDRGFEWRDKILAKHHYDPRTDLVRAVDGHLQLIEDGSGRMTAMEADIKAYFASRNEDVSAT